MSVIRRKDKTAWRMYDDQGVLLDVESGTVLGLNATAARIWELIGDETTADAIARQVVDEFSVSEEQARAGVDAHRSLLLTASLGKCMWAVPTGPYIS